MSLMALLVPDNGGSVNRVMTSAGVEYGLIGPIPEGRWVDLIYVSVRSSGATTLDTGFSMGPSGSPGAEEFAAGTPFVQRSESVLEGIPIVRTIFGSEGAQRFILAVGRRVGAGPSFIHVGFVSSQNVTVTWIVSARILGLARMILRPGEGPAEVVMP